jgi:hypothetical protein
VKTAKEKERAPTHNVRPFSFHLEIEAPSFVTERFKEFLSFRESRKNR